MMVDLQKVIKIKDYRSEKAKKGNNKSPWHNQNFNFGKIKKEKKDAK